VSFNQCSYKICALNIFEYKCAVNAGLSVTRMPVDSTSELLKHYEVYETIGSGNVMPLDYAFMENVLDCFRDCVY